MSKPHADAAARALIIERPERVTVRRGRKLYEVERVSCPLERFAIIFFDDGRRIEMEWSALISCVERGAPVIY